MTTLSPSPSPSPSASAPRSPSPRHGLGWAVHRLHRVPLAAWAVLVVAGAGWLLWLRGRGQDGGLTDGCATVPLLCATESGYASSELRAARLLAWLPCGIAAVAGAALVGRELERGTATVAWTQSVPPARWLAAKLAVPAAALLAGVAALTLIFRWVWSSGPDEGVNRWNSEYFHAAGTVGPAYVLLGLALGALAALLTRRVLPSAGLALAGIGLAYHLGDRVRSSLWPASEVRGPLDTTSGQADQLEFGMILESGERVSGLDCADQAVPGDLGACLADHGATDFYAKVHPASHYWPIQLVETGLVLALAAATAATAFWALRRSLP
ncbi:ABC transporter permease [Streptomyces sp. 4N509B]|uniref:ABC transporter permease n=1 Tax=Streptomyces sp. 4N509B TaxID=3457413 RepID=UPI003FD24F83